MDSLIYDSVLMKSRSCVPLELSGASSLLAWSRAPTGAIEKNRCSITVSCFPFQRASAICFQHTGSSIAESYAYGIASAGPTKESSHLQVFR